MSMEKMVEVAAKVNRMLRSEEKRHRAASIAAINQVMCAYERGEVTAEEYEEFVGETYADTLHRKFDYELQDARDEAEEKLEQGHITQEEAEGLMARVDAAGGKDTSALPVVKRETVVLPPVSMQKKEGEGNGN